MTSSRYAPAPAARNIGSGNSANTAVMANPTKTPMTSTCAATLLAPSRSPRPMRLAMACEAPTPSPLPMPMRMKKNGNTTPVAASAAVPILETQMASTKLFSDCTIMPMAIGTTIAIRDFLGSPRMFPVLFSDSVIVIPPVGRLDKLDGWMDARRPRRLPHLDTFLTYARIAD